MKTTDKLRKMCFYMETLRNIQGQMRDIVAARSTQQVREQFRLLTRQARYIRSNIISLSRQGKSVCMTRNHV